MIKNNVMITKITGVMVIIKTLKVTDWPLHLLVHFGILKEREITYNFRNGIKLKGLRSASHDEPGFYFNYIFKKQCYTPPNLVIKEDDIIVDVGAHIGMFTVFAAKQAKKGRVYAYEPMVGSFNLLKQNIHLNALSNVVAFDLGIAGKAERRKLFLTNRSEGHSLFCPTESYVEIQCIALKNVFDLNNLPKIDFLKLNCEGAEYEILFNTDEEYLKKIDKISLSYHTKSKGVKEHNQKDLIDFLRTNNFTITFPTVTICHKHDIIYAKQTKI